MARKAFIYLSFYLFLFPTALSAQDLLPAICQQILSPVEEKSVPEVILDHISNKAKTVPAAILSDVRGAADSVADLVADSIESKKKPASMVLGASTASADDGGFLDSIYNKGLETVAFLIRHWFYSLVGLGVLVVGWFLRF